MGQGTDEGQAQELKLAGLSVRMGEGRIKDDFQISGLHAGDSAYKNEGHRGLRRAADSCV